MNKLFFLLISITFLAACTNKEEERREQDDQLIQDYFATNGITDAEPADENSGVYFRITEPGNNEDYPTANSTIRTFYKGYLLDGTVFDEAVEGEDNYLESPLFNLVYGWRVAFPNFSKGAKGQIFIPSHAGYGGRPPAGSVIPEHAVLIFDVHLVNTF
jgi:FKBP-type peptidyl-prolyl cis-trans isomerase FkpA